MIDDEPDTEKPTDPDPGKAQLDLTNGGLTAGYQPVAGSGATRPTPPTQPGATPQGGKK